ncbi:MAG: murein L,D-transpeptidase [Hyphomicrobiales bacterium]|nr:murein L,D-transpeptidase [Hyphomicrobiales bacterium]
MPPHLKPLPAEAKALLAQKGMREDAPIFVRVFKEESELEVWKAKDDGRYHHFKTYPICTWSGKLGPKQKQGDKQAPEGFYRVARRQMNPNSAFHLSFNLGYPNRFDRAHKRTGAHLMVHGDCKSAGCYAMTDALMEEIYILAREAFNGGQEKFDVHAYPFRMTDANMRRHRWSRWRGFWKNLKQGYDHFEATRIPPRVEVCEKRYLVNAAFVNEGARVDPAGRCPAYQHLPVEALPPAPKFQEAKSGTNPQATIGYAPKKPSVAGFAFRLNSILSR